MFRVFIVFQNWVEERPPAIKNKKNIILAVIYFKHLYFHSINSQSGPFS